MQTLLKNTQAYTLLKTEAEENRFGHAYLLTFQDGRNLRRALKEFAKLFFHGDQRISNLIDTESFSDCLFFPAEGKKLAVDDAETIREESTLSPVEGERKLFVVGDFAEANTQTQNKLLKLLEEPPKGVIFLLGATSVFPVLTTVLSRTKRLELLPFSTDDTTDCLERIYGDKYPREALELCAATSDGNVGEAQNMLEGGQYRTLLESAFELALSAPAGLPLAVKKIGETKHQKELIALLRLIFRDALLMKTGQSQKHLLLRGERERVTQTAKKYASVALIYAQEALAEAEKQVRFNAVFAQCIELCLAKIQRKNK